ncbi:MAG: amidohydrolase [Firmicutes bacterium]|nr:amidohydrolase [Bacillota bacterium]
MAATKLFYGGHIYTVDAKRSWAEAVAIESNRIIYVGDLAGAASLCDESTERIDLEGKMLLPGFIDGHCHPILAAHYLCGVYLEIEYSVQDCLDAIRAYVEENPEEETYFGIGYAEWIFDETGPKKELLDEICPDKPMMILGSSAHEAWVNSKALELAGITKDTPDPIPGFHYFHRDGSGEPTGHLVETGPQIMITDKVNFFKADTVRRMIELNSAGYASMGVTTTCDMGCPEFGQDFYFRTIPEMIEAGTYMQRFFGCGRMVADKSEIELILGRLQEQKDACDTDFFNIHFLKIINDGTLETRSAALSEPYNEDGSMVQPLLTREEIARLGVRAAKAGLDINVHAIGDEAISGTLAMAKAVREAGFDDCRIVNSHCDYVKDEELGLFGKYDVIANTTCVWHYGNPDMEAVIGDRQNRTFRLKSMIDGGCRMGQGSDFPVDEFGREPLKGIEMGCTRQLFDHPELPVLKPYEEKLSVDDGIASYTINNAYQMHAEDRLGSIEEGKLADLVILEKNLFDVPLSEIHKVRVCETILDGTTVFRA